LNKENKEITVIYDTHNLKYHPFMYDVTVYISLNNNSILHSTNS
jgi:hypothetical protein